MHNREKALRKWLEEVLSTDLFILTPLTGDASFRRYFRLQVKGRQQIVMDAPPDKEAIGSFLAVGKLLTVQGLCTPQVHAVDQVQGFAILDDFGDRLLLNSLTPQNADAFYQTAMDLLLLMQNCEATDEKSLPAFDKNHILLELDLFKSWFIERYLKITLTTQELSFLNQFFAWLSEELAKQPQGFIHRDYHSRNIMLLDGDSTFGIIDFQDAMIGPITYDLVSLLKDCYIQWPRDRVINWVKHFYSQSKLAQQCSLKDFIRSFDLCGLQRHLKVLGIFSRLYLRDNKSGYLQNLPLTHHYVMACLEEYQELTEFYQLMQKRIALP